MLTLALAFLALPTGHVMPQRSLLVQHVAADARLAEYQPYWAARAELLSRTSAQDEAHSAYGMAIGLERDDAVRRFLQRRQSALAR